MQTTDPTADELQRLADYSGAPWKPENAYFAHAERYMEQSWTNTIWPFIRDSDLTHVVDLAAGHGRNTAKLLDRSQEIFILDIQAGNIEACRRRFGDAPNLHYAVNNGYDMRPVGDGWSSLIYCFDAMVHFDSDVVRSYLRDSRRVLRSGGRGFFHHSNYVEGSSDWTKGKGSRNFMSRALFRHYAQKEGLEVIKQEVIDWGEHKQLDCLSLVAKPMP